MSKRDHVIEVDVGNHARMLLPTDVEWHLRYGDAARVRFVAAEVVVRRMRLLRKAHGARAGR
jgi:hypothetical protein